MTLNETEIILGGLRLTHLSKDKVLELLLKESMEFKAAFVVTPNTGHLAHLRTDTKYQNAMKSALISVPDGWPLALLASIALRRQIGRISGSDLIFPLCELAARESLSVGFLGGEQGALEKASIFLKKKIPNLNILYLEPYPLAKNDDEIYQSKVVHEINQKGMNFLFVGLGCPKQEIFVNEILCGSNVGVILCIGAGIDFISGQKKRAPLFLQKLGFEWLYRMCQEPRRLARRYMRAFAETLLLVSKIVFKCF
jgi:N-acetylglucosaminyldiphosphoundecaprenol N-acetyl-beta-D-mannosaminyltransferase